VKKLSDYVIEFVARTGAQHIFMLAGGGSMHLVDSVGCAPNLEFVCCLHEQTCALAAEAYAEYTNHLGVALVTTGPGGTNAVTGVAAAWIEGASCLFLSGQAKRADLIGRRGVRSLGPQEVDIVSIVRPITKYARTILDPQSIRSELEKAVFIATHGRRGPVWLDIPLDVQSAMIDETTLPQWEGPSSSVVCQSPSLASQVSQGIALLNQSQRPVLFLGNGVKSAAAQGLVDRLIETLQIPVLLTWKVADLLPEDHPFYAGRPGTMGQRAANFTQQNGDCILVIGARLDLPQIAFSHQNFAPAASKIIVDIDAAELAKFQMPIDVSVCADAADFIAEFLRQSGTLIPKDRHCWLQRSNEWQARYPVVLPEYWNSPDGIVNVYALMDALSGELAATDLLVPGSSGPCSDIFMQAFRVQAGQRIVNAPGLGAMGTGLPGTIGACLASGRKRTICVNGDGGFQLNIQDLETVRRLNLPIKYFVLSNGGYASIIATQRNFFQGRFTGSEPSSGLTLPDLVRVAEAYGIPAMEIADQSRLREGIRAALAHDGPIVCAVRTSPDQPTAPRVTSEMRPGGVMVSKPMEDMWPFLPREEFLSNMIVPPLEEA
jgi:acetolactate synthase I/II/III large subunit